MTIEIVAQSIEDALAAERAGADRLELVSALTLGGLTPSLGSLKTVISRCKLPTVAMLRPRSGGFQYSAGELDAMEGDGERFLAEGAQGLVFGVLDGGGIDARANARLVRLGGEAVFHRAFDTLSDPMGALERLIDLGFRRVLTSGGRGTAHEGETTIRRLVESADGRIEILPAGGIRPANVLSLAATTGVSAVHLAASQWIEDPTANALRFNAPHPEDRYARVDEKVVASIRTALGK